MERGVEIILYDHTPGGTGFVQEGYAQWQEVLREAREVCKACTRESAFYECLKSYSNQGKSKKQGHPCQDAVCATIVPYCVTVGFGLTG